MAIVFALGILLVFAILGLALNANVGGLANQTSVYSALAMMDHAAFEIAGSVFFSLEKDFRNAESDNYQSVFTGAEQVELEPLWPDEGQLAQANDLHLDINDIEIKCEKTAAIGTDWLWQDENEKFLKIILTVDLSGGRSKYKMFRRRYRFVKKGKILSLGLPLLSKFTLFVKNPEKTDENNAGYNCVANFVDGKIGHSSTAQPVCFTHSQEINQNDVFKAGWVFLGGDDEIQLHVSSGNHIDHGELFQFHSITQPEKSPPVFEFNNLPSTDVFNNGAFFLDSGIKAELSIRGSYYGFYQWDKYGSDMNRNGVLQRYFSSTNSRTMNSSFLHLSGNYALPTPTLVVGKVKRVFAYYSGIIYSASGEGGSAKFLDMLEAPPKMQSDSGEVAFWNTLNLKRSFSGDRFNRERLEFSSYEVTASKLFGSKSQYLTYCSNLIVEPYNSVYDYMYNTTGKLPPEKRLENDCSVDYEIDGKNFQLKKINDESQILFNGNCNEISSENLLLDRVTRIVTNEEKFKEKYLVEGKLDLNYQNVLIKDSLNLPANLEVVNPGILFVQGRLMLNGGIKKCEKGPLTLVALKDDIAFKADNQELWAHLVALEGTVYPSTNNPVDIFGAIAMDKLYAKNDDTQNRCWSAGGKVQYDQRLDPTRNEVIYSINLSDYYDEFQVQKEN